MSVPPPVPAAAGLLLLAAAAVLVPPGRPGRGRVRALAAGARPAMTVRMRRLSGQLAGHRRACAAASATAGGLAGLALAGPAAALAGAAYGWYGARCLLRSRARRRAESARARTLDAVTALTDDLRAGLPPLQALGRAWPALTGAVGCAAGATVGALPLDPVAALRDVRAPELATITGRLAAAWLVAERTGAPLTDLLGRLDAELSAADRLRRRASAQAAGAHATALLLAVLPVLGLGFGYVIGADPLAFLLHTVAGVGCIVLTLALQAAGAVWTRRLSGVGAAGGVT